MKKLLLIVMCAILSNCASINKFSYDVCYKQTEIRLIGDRPHYWDKGTFNWVDLEESYRYSVSKSPDNRNSLDKWTIEIYNRYTEKIQAMMEN